MSKDQSQTRRGAIVTALAGASAVLAAKPEDKV